MTSVQVTQQRAVYDAEAVTPVGRTFESLEAVQAFLDGLRDEPWWPERVARVEVGPNRGAGRDSVGWFDRNRNAGRIELNPDHRFERIVLHELAHVITDAEGGAPTHDPWFCRRYTELVYRVMGSEAWTALVESFKEHGVDYG